MKKSVAVLVACVLCLACGASAQKADTPASTPAPAAAAAAKSEPLPSLDSILERYIKSAGGKAAIEKIDSQVMTGILEVNGGSIPMEIAQKYPGKWRVEVKLPEGESFLQVSDGSKVWMRAPGSGATELSEAVALESRRGLDLRRAIHLKEYFPKMEVKGKDKVGDQPVYVIEATPAQGHAVTMYLDAESGIELREDSTMDTPQGPLEQTTFYEDYKDFHGQMFPYTLRQINSAQSTVIKVTDVQRNVAIDEKKFVKPE